MCYSVVNNYLSAGRNRFDLESGPWTIRATFHILLRHDDAGGLF